MAECVDNHWQPTFVHDVDKPDGPYYVLPGGQSFVKLRGNSGPEWVQHACELINQFGIRNPAGFTTCQDYTRIQCGCKRRLSEGNSTCAAFLGQRP